MGTIGASGALTGEALPPGVEVRACEGGATLLSWVPDDYLFQQLSRLPTLLSSCWSAEAPLALVCGLRDELVPAHMTPALRAAAVRAARTELHAVAGGTHNDTWLAGGAGYWAFLREFLASTAGPAARG